MSEKRQLPPFKNEEEEAQWWYDNREERGAAMIAAMRDGTGRWRTPAERMAALNSTVKLDPADVKVAYELAKRRGVDLHVFLQQIMHEAIERERDRVA